MYYGVRGLFVLYKSSKQTEQSNLGGRGLVR